MIIINYINQKIKSVIVVLFFLLASMIPSFLSAQHWGLWPKHTINDSLLGSYKLEVVDLDGDSFLDIVVVAFDYNSVVWFKGPFWEKHIIDDSLTGAHGLDVADLDMDNDLDIIAVGVWANDVLWYEAPHWIKHTIDDSLESPPHVLVTDLNDDDTLDVAATSWYGNQVVWYKGPGPAWTKYVIDDDLDGASHIQVADLNEDNILDLIISAAYDHDIVYYEGPDWDKKYITTNLRHAYDIHVIDMNEDGLLDVVAAGALARTVLWYEAPSWNPHIIDDKLYSGHPDLWGATFVDVVDMNNDSILDLVASEYGGEVVWYQGPNWNKFYIDNSLKGAEDVWAVDMNEDSKLDVVAAAWDDGSVVWYEHPLAQVIYLDLSSPFIHPGTDTLLFHSEIHNPKDINLEVKSLIQSIDSTFIDTVMLNSAGFVDGRFWGQFIPLSSLENAFTVNIVLNGATTSGNNLISFPKHFTTIGPITFEGYTMLSSEIITLPMPGYKVTYSFSLNNMGLSAPAPNVTAKVINTDSCASFLQWSPKYVSDLIYYGDIAPGESVQFEYDIYYFNNCSDPVHFALEIYSEGYHFWSDTFSVVTAIEKSEYRIPKVFALGQNYPNPFNPITKIEYQLPKISQVNLSVYNILGQNVATIISEKQKAGYYKVEWDGSNLSSGVYLYQLKTGDGFIKTRKFVLIK